MSTPEPATVTLPITRTQLTAVEALFKLAFRAAKDDGHRYGARVCGTHLLDSLGVPDEIGAYLIALWEETRS